MMHQQGNPQGVLGQLNGTSPTRSNGKPTTDSISNLKKNFKWPATFNKRFSSTADLNIGKQLGKGGFSEVFKATEKRDSSKTYAVKKVDLRQINYEDFDIIREEVAIHSTISHPNIVQFIDWMKEGEAIYIVMEYIDNGTVFEYINHNHPLKDDFIKKIIIQTLDALQYLHDSSIIHRDLKPENILLDTNLNVKICDFGWSERKKAVNKSGTIVYMAPEILKLQTYDQSVDIWTIGVLLFELYHNIEPYQGNDPSEVLNAIRNKQLKYDSHCPQQARELIKYILNVEPKARPSIEQIKAHYFLRSDVGRYSTAARTTYAQPQAPQVNGTAYGPTHPSAKENPFKQNGESYQNGSPFKPAFSSPTLQPIPQPATSFSASNSKILSTISQREIYSQPYHLNTNGGLHLNGGNAPIRSEVGNDYKAQIQISSSTSHRVLRTNPLQEQVNGRSTFNGSQPFPQTLKLTTSPSNTSSASPEISMSPDNNSRTNFPFMPISVGPRKELSLMSQIQSVGQDTPPRTQTQTQFEQPGKPAPITIRGTHFTTTVSSSPQQVQWNQEVLQQTRSPAPYDVFENSYKQRSPAINNALRATSYTVTDPTRTRIQPMTPIKEDPKTNRLRTTEFTPRPNHTFESPVVSEFRPTNGFSRPPQVPMQITSNPQMDNQPITIRSGTSSAQGQTPPQILNHSNRFGSARLPETSPPIASMISQAQLPQRPAVTYQHSPPQYQPAQTGIAPYSGTLGLNSASNGENYSETRTIRSVTSGPAFGSEFVAQNTYQAYPQALKLYNPRAPESISANNSPIQKLSGPPSAVMAYRPVSQTYQPLQKPDQYSPLQLNQQKAFTFHPQTQTSPTPNGLSSAPRLGSLQLSPGAFSSPVTPQISALTVQQPQLQPIQITSSKPQPSQQSYYPTSQPTTNYDHYGGNSSTSARVLRG